jgi:hypothetical protein
MGTRIDSQAGNMQTGEVSIWTPYSPENGSWSTRSPEHLYCHVPGGSDPNCGSFFATIIVGDPPSLEIQSANMEVHGRSTNLSVKLLGTDGPKSVPLTETQECSNLLSYQGQIIYNPFHASANMQSPNSLMPQVPTTYFPPPVVRPPPTVAPLR